EHRALVQTVDFFTPVVDDPIAYGRIAAANALSDVYAMGGRPLTALAIAGFPQDADRTILSAIFAGGLQGLNEARVALLGGHTVQDQEIKFGYAITGEVDPGRIWTNAGAQPGDHLFLTKPLGTGVIATAIKFGRAPQAVADAAIASMVQLNRAAAESLMTLPAGSVHACTDVTGFGLVGHATEMAVASRGIVSIDVGAVPTLDGALDLIEQNTPGGGRTNLQHFAAGVMTAPGVDRARAQLLYDPQTSGGLLVAVAPVHVAAVLEAWQRAGVRGYLVGTFETAAPQGHHSSGARSDDEPRRTVAVKLR
ncbi:MAG: selenide, water dikinase SelD, partial [Vicinamibacterales bacterium]